MRVLLLTNEYPNPLQPDKAVFNRHLVRALARCDEVAVVSPIAWVDEWRARRTNSRLGAERRDWSDGVAVHYPRYWYPPKVLHARYDWFYWHSVRGTVREMLATHRPDVVLSYWAHPDGAAALRAARAAGLPCAIMVGGSDVLQLTHSPARRRRIAAVLQAVDAVIAVSQDIADRLRSLGVSAAKIHVVPRGVDGALFSPGERQQCRARLSLPADVPVFVWVGRMVPVKGLDVLLTACEQLRARQPAFRLCLIGDGPLRASLQAEVAARKLTDHVQFVGLLPQEQLGDWYRAADLTVLPSLSEGIPNVLRESLACGTPFVASRVGGIPEIAPPDSCRLVSPGDPAALAQAIDERVRQPVALSSGEGRPMTWQESAERLREVLLPLTRTDQRAAPRRCSWRQYLRRALQAVLPRRLMLFRGPRTSSSVCLTFDDGPHPEHTPRLLDVLKEHNLRATFFVIGERAAQYPEIIRRMAAEGHVIGNHTYRHLPPDEVTAPALLDEVGTCRELLGGLLGKPPDWFRPPHGKVTAAKLWALWRANQTVVLWNQDPRDFACADAETLQRWFDDRPLRGGDVVLLHDDRPHAAAVVPALVRAVRGRQLEFTTIAEWLP